MLFEKICCKSVNEGMSSNLSWTENADCADRVYFYAINQFESIKTV